MKKYNFGLVGYGGMGNQHLKLMETVDFLNLKGIVDIDPTKEEKAKENNINVYESYEDMLADADLDIVLIATPNDVHKQQAIDALYAGKHVICEKPVTLNSEELSEIIAASKETGNVFMVHQNRRWDEDFLIIKDFYDNKELGEIYNVEARIYGSRGIPGDWRRLEKHGGGMLLDWGVHLIDRILWMVNKPVTTVYCEESYRLGEECDDGFVLKMNFEGGFSTHLEVGTNNYIYMPKFYACGEIGTVIIEDWEMNGHVSKLKQFSDKDAKPIEAGAGLTKTMAPRDEKTLDILPLPRIESDIRDFYRNFRDVIEGKAEAIVKNEEVLKTMQIIEIARESSRTKQVIQIKE